jgi:hypothetical protein
MAEFIFHETIISNEILVRVYADDITGIPTRVETRGDSRRYRFYMGDRERVEGMTVRLETVDTTSRNIDPILAAKMNTRGASQIVWMCGVEGV